MLEVLVMAAGASGSKIEITANAVEAYPGQPINFSVNTSGIAVGTTLYWSVEETDTTPGADRLYDGVVTGSAKVVLGGFTVSRRLLGKTLAGRSIQFRIAKTLAEAANQETALASSAIIPILKTPTGSTGAMTSSRSVLVPANVWVMTAALASGGGGGGGGTASGAFRSATGGSGGRGGSFNGLCYVTPGTNVTFSCGKGGNGGSIAGVGGSGGSTQVTGLAIAISYTVSTGGGGGGGVGDNQSGASGASGASYSGGASGGAGGPSKTAGSAGSAGSGTLTWGL